MVRARALLAPVSFLVAALLAPAAAHADPRESVRAALAGIESVADPSNLVRVPGAEAALHALVDDPAAPLTLRARAVVALGQFPTAVTRQLLERLTRGEDVPEPLRTRAPMALVRVAPEAALPSLRAALAASNPFVRGAAARAVAALPSPEATAILRELVRTERDPVVLESLREVAR